MSQQWPPVGWSPVDAGAVAVVAAIVAGGARRWVRGRPVRRLARVVGHRPAGPRPAWQRRLDRLAHSRAMPLLAGAGTAGLGGALGGPVAAVIAGAYTTVAAVAWRSRRARLAADRAFTTLVDAVDATAADLRAGLSPDPAASRTSSVAPAADDVRFDAAIQAAVARLEAAYRISEALGAPLADLLDRVDGDLRAERRVRATVQAQTSGARATSVLLAGLPIAGLALGAGMGADPIDELLHTPLGGGCAVAAVLLQCVGLMWTDWLVRGVNATARR